MYEYEVVEKSIKRPKDVAEAYSEHNNGDYLTLMACYPIGTAAQRILVVAKLKTSAGKQLSYK